MGNNDETFDDQNTSGVSTQPWSTAKPLPPTNTATELSKTIDELKTLDDFFPEKIMLANEEQDGSEGEQEDADDSSQDMLDPVFENQAYVLKDVKNIYIKFLLNSTDKNNFGERKGGKEWHLLVIPLTKHRAKIIRNSSQATELTLDECIPHSTLRIQVKTEVRRNQKLTKDHRNVEVEWPVFKSKKRQRLEKLYFQKKKKKIAKLTDEELQKKIGQIC